MNAHDARRLLLLRAFEHPPTPPWSAADADWATREALRHEGEQATPEALHRRRTALAFERLAPRDAGLAALAARRPALGWTALLVPLAALLLGLGSGALSAAPRIELLPLPLLALLGWNLAVYALLFARALRAQLPRAAPAGPGPLRRGLVRRLAELQARAAHWWSARPAADAPALLRFARDWAQASAGLNAARIAALLHAGAMVWALGALAALYARGLFFEYRASWQSTWLSAEQMQALLQAVLGPAAEIAGYWLPSAAQLEALRHAAGPGAPAAAWIHLHALTVVLVVLLPRAALALHAAWRARRLARDFPLALDAPATGGPAARPAARGARAVLFTYNYRSGGALLAALRTALEPRLGRPLQLRLDEPVPLGGEDEPARWFAQLQPDDAAVALFALSATPEDETHGAFVRALVQARPAPEARRVVLVDTAGFAERYGPARLAERCAAWRRVVEDAGDTPLFADLSQAAAREAAA